MPVVRVDYLAVLGELHYLDIRSVRTLLNVSIAVGDLGVDDPVLGEEHLPGGGASLEHVADEVAPVGKLEVGPSAGIGNLLFEIQSVVFKLHGIVELITSMFDSLTALL